LHILSLISHTVIGIIYAFYTENGFSKFVTVVPVPLNDRLYCTAVMWPSAHDLSTNVQALILIKSVSSLYDELTGIKTLKQILEQQATVVRHA